jgi:hypothetical protein
LEPTATTSKVSRNSLKSLFIQIVMNCQVANSKRANFTGFTRSSLQLFYC